MSTRRNLPQDRERQTIEHLRAEIAFRAKLARQHVDGEMLLPDYYAKDEHDRILLERVDATRRAMRRLERRGIVLSPFVELGAERGQRSLVLANEFGGDGVAVDISWHQLRTMEHFAALFGMPRLPLRVCADANALPFRSGSVPFAFAYQFLHHFPAPGRPVSEIHRVLSGGHFFFAEEPFRRVLQVVLYRQRTKASSSGAMRRNRYRRLIESFISEESCDESEHGVIENDRIELATWIRALGVFDDWKATLSSIYDVRSTLRGRVRLRNRLNWLLGGLIEAVCTKNGTQATRRIVDALACPDCLLVAADGTRDRPSLRPVPGGGYGCERCERVYPERDGVLLLLPEAATAALYPELL